MKNTFNPVFVFALAGLLFFAKNIAAQTETIPAGSFIVDMGVVPQTIGNGLKPYGLVYSLIENYNVPVRWAINPNKNFGGVDFSYNGYDFRGGPFIITTPSRTAVVNSEIAAWQAQGVAGITTTADLTVPIYRTLTEFTNVVIDQQNEALVIPYYNNAGISSSSYRIGSPADLNYCDDMYAMPHADPEWTTHQNLLYFNTNLNGFIWAGCHAVSMLEALINPADSSQRTNFLTQSGMQCWKINSCEPPITEFHAQQPTLPYLYDSSTGGLPVMQFMEDMTPSTENGSEPWYIPLNTGTWNPGAIRCVKTSDGASPREGVKLVYGRGFDNPSNGMVMYEGGHTGHNNGSIQSQVAFQRAYFNFVLMAGLERHIDTVTADFSYSIIWTNNCDSFMVQFVNNSTGDADYYWDFGDGATSTDSAVTHLFIGNDSVEVMLATVTTSWCGLSDTTYQPIHFNPVLDTLDFDFIFSESLAADCDSLLAQFNTSISGNATASWDFGNGMTATGTSVSFAYTDTGIYNVTLTVTPASPCTIGRSISRQVTFSPTRYASIADFTHNVIYSNTCDTFVVKFNNLSSGGTSYLWDFGNGSASANFEETITYAAGNYNVSLQVNDSHQCSTNDTAFLSLVFTSTIVNPLADFTYDVATNCDVSEVNFSNRSSGTSNFIWRLNNNVSSSLLSPDGPLQYYQSDTINVELSTAGTNNCYSNDTISKTIFIPAPYGYPVADFNFMPVNPEVDEVIQFTNLSQRADLSLYQWNFGDGSTTAEINPQHAYTQKGVYDICLSADNGYNCPSIACKDIPVIYTEVVELPTAFTPNGDNHNDIFIVRGKDIERIDLKIFNRWGELVFQSKDLTVGWDGTFKEDPQEMEVYDWLLNATLKSGAGIFKKGNVTLLR